MGVSDIQSVLLLASSATAVSSTRIKRVRLLQMLV
jgi:hypothetical protein